jgi:hypothetical protein
MEVMAVVTMPVVMAVVSMPMMTMMTMVPVMAMMAVAAMLTVAVTAAGESLTRDGKRGSCQRQSSDSGCNDLLEVGHACLLGCAARGSPCDDPT